MRYTITGSVRQRGFTFLEFIIVSGVLLVAIIGLLFTFINCTLLNDTNNEMVTAAGDAQYILEQMKSLAYDDIDSYTPPSFAHLLNETIPSPIITQVSQDVKEVTVSVNWTDKRGRARTFSLTTRFAQH